MRPGEKSDGRASGSDPDDRDMAGFIFFYFTVFSIILNVGRATEEHAQIMEATSPGDLIISGIFNIHEGVDKSRDTFEPKPLECIR